ncbi:hypothetical protein Avbf_13521, partial [Armadillidium vulgare]
CGSSISLIFLKLNIRLMKFSEFLVSWSKKKPQPVWEQFLITIQTTFQMFCSINIHSYVGKYTNSNYGLCRSQVGLI